jgi:hypothetical protein
MRASLLKVKLESKLLFDAFDQVKTFYWGNFLRWYASEQIEHSTVIIQPVRVVNIDRTKVDVQLMVTYADRMFSDFSNIDEIQSEGADILSDFIAIMNKSPRWRAFITGATSGNIEFFEQKGGDLVAGCAMLVNVSISTIADLCAVPVTDYDFSGDTTLVPSCANGTVRVFNSIEELLSTVLVSSGGVTDYTAPDATYTVQYVDGTPIESGTIPSGGSVTVNVPNVITCLDANWMLTDSLGNTLDSGTIPSGGSATIVAPDATSNINKSSGALIQSVSVPSGGIANTNIADSVITLNNTAATTLSTTNVLATDAATIVAPDGDVNNSDSTYTASVASGGALSLPDSQINVNSASQGNVVSVKTIDVNVTDGVDPVTPDAVTLVGNTLTIEVPSGAVAPVGATLMKTGQTTSFRTGDDGDLQEGRDVDFFTLAENNPFGNTQRFTGVTGGYYDQTLAGYYDKDGVATTKALAIPDNIVIDWSTYNGTNVLGHSLDVDATSVTWGDAIDNALAYSVGSFISGWRLPNFNECISICDFSRVRFVQNTVFDNLNVCNLWTSTTRPSTTANAYLLALPSSAPFLDRAKTLTFQHNQVRTFTVTGTTLT